MAGLLQRKVGFVTLPRMQTKSDADLLEAYASKRDELAFGELMRRHTAMVYHACYRLLKDACEAEDASQAVFLVLARKADRLRKDNLSAWLYRVAHLVAAETVRKRMRRVSREENYAREEAIQGGDFTPDKIVDTTAVLGMLDSALLGLPERYREAVILRYLQNYSQEDAAQLAGCPLGTMKRRASEGIAKLRQRLAKRGVALSSVALAGLLSSEASAAVPETLLPSILATVKTALPAVALGAKVGVATTAATTTATSTAAMLAKGAMKAMFWNSVKTAAMVAVSVGVVGVGGVAAVQAVAEKAGAKPPTVVEQNAGTASNKLSRKDTPDIVQLCNVHWYDIGIKPRSDSSQTRRKIEDRAMANGFKIAWVRDGKLAVIYVGVADTEIERVRKDLASTDADVRGEAAWRGGWMSDPRIVPLLRQAAIDADSSAARQALVSLRRLGWRAVLALDGTAIALLEKEIANGNQPVWDVCNALALDGSRNALVLLAEALDDPRVVARHRAARGLGASLDLPLARVSHFAS